MNRDQFFQCSLALCLVLGTTLTVAPAQTTAQRPEFEVASVRANKSGSGSFSVSMPAGRYETSNVPLREIIRSAFQLKDYQIAGPDWIKSEHYDIQAKMPEGSSKDQVYPMIQALLADRFKMQFHRETREMPIYALLVSKAGAHLTPADDSNDRITPAAPTRLSGGGSPSATGAVIAPAGAVPGSVPPEMRPTMQNVGSLSGFADSLSRILDRPVIDMTGLGGRYNIRLSYKKETDPADDPRPSIFAAVMEQLGLRLESRKGPVEIIVIDSIARAD